jgi:hypothetical protein
MGASEAVTAFQQMQGALGLFFTGVGVLWLVSVHREKERQRLPAARTSACGGLPLSLLELLEPLPAFCPSDGWHAGSGPVNPDPEANQPVQARTTV